MSRWIAALLVVLATHAASASAYAMVVAVPACRVIIGPDPEGLWPFWATGAVSSLGVWPGTAVMYCDIGLPPEATGFDFVDFEYRYSPAASTDLPPTATVFLDVDGAFADGAPYAVSMELGECAGNTATQGSEMSVCRAWGNVAFPTKATYAESIHAVVYLPGTEDSSDDEAIRLVAHYEAP
jgi:hypothetical protein